MPAVASSSTARPSWLARISAVLGVLSLVAVLCFHFPEWLTSREFRQVYSEQFARALLLLGLVLAFVLGTLAILRGRERGPALLGVGAATIAVLLGGSDIQFESIGETPYSLGLDWFVVSLLFSALVFVPLERALGRIPQSPMRPQWRTDLAYFFVSHVLVQFMLIAITAWTSGVAALAAFPALQSALSELPAWLQFPLAVLCADLAQASLHRAYHRFGPLWRLHAVHHSSQHMDWLAGSRMHLLEILFTRSMVLLPLVMLGFDPAAINAYVILVGLQAVLAHANLRLDFGWLEQVLVLPRYHHWHHAREPGCEDINYAIHLPWVDRLMGTFRLPADGSWPREYGLREPGEVPDGIVAQHLAPFRSARRKRVD